MYLKCTPANLGRKNHESGHSLNFTLLELHSPLVARWPSRLGCSPMRRRPLKRGYESHHRKHFDNLETFLDLGSTDFEVQTSHTPRSRHPLNTLKARNNNTHGSSSQIRPLWFIVSSARLLPLPLSSNFVSALRETQNPSSFSLPHAVSLLICSVCLS